VVLVAGEGPQEGLGTWRGAAAPGAESSPRERRERTLGVGRTEDSKAGRVAAGRYTEVTGSRPEDSADLSDLKILG
jgi:hypothetical protein